MYHSVFCIWLPTPLNYAGNRISGSAAEQAPGWSELLPQEMAIPRPAVASGVRLEAPADVAIPPISRAAPTAQGLPATLFCTRTWVYIYKMMKHQYRHGSLWW
jgi:hypothetical protein